MEDHFIRGLLILGLLTVTTSIVTPLECNFCRRSGGSGMDKSLGNGKDDYPEFNRWWVNRHCTSMAAHQFILYFTLTPLLMVFLVLLIEKCFDLIFKAYQKVGMILSLLFKDQLLESKEEKEILH